MKTAVNIPWDAVVNGCPPSQATHLPLVVSERPVAFTSTVLKHIEAILTSRLAGPLMGAVQQTGSPEYDPMSMIHRATGSTYLELTLSQFGGFAILTSDGETSVMLQAVARPSSVAWLKDAALRRDAFARKYVARYARFDADARAFLSASTLEEEDSSDPRFEFLNPTSWGFTKTPNENITSMHWTAHNLFHSPTPPKTPAKNSPATRQRFKDPFEEPTPDRGDPFQCIPQLRQFRTLCDQFAMRGGVGNGIPLPVTSSNAEDHRQASTLAHATQTSKVAHANLGLAQSLGQCRLFAVKLSDAQDFTLSPICFDQASLELINLLKSAIDWAVEIESKADTCPPYLHRNFAMDLLEIRMDAHAAYQALDEAYAAARYESHPQADAMGRRLNQVRRMINLFDGNLKKQLPLLRLAASTFLLENWRRLLAPAFRELPPWWLDGCLE